MVQCSNKKNGHIRRMPWHLNFNMRLIIVDRGNILYRGFNDDKDINDDKWVYFVTRTINLKLLLLTKFNLPMTTPKTILYFNPLFSTKSKLPWIVYPLRLDIIPNFSLRNVWFTLIYINLLIVNIEYCCSHYYIKRTSRHSN